MKTLNLKEMEVIEGGVRFFGPEYIIHVDFDSSCASGLRANLYRDYYVMGIRTGHTLQSEGACVEAITVE